MPSFDGNLLIQRHQHYSFETRDSGLSHSEDFMILSCVVLTQYSSVTDRQTDVKDTSAVGKTRLASPLTRCYMLSRVKIINMQRTLNIRPYSLCHRVDLYYSLLRRISLVDYLSRLSRLSRRISDQPKVSRPYNPTEINRATVSRCACCRSLLNE